MKCKPEKQNSENIYINRITIIKPWICLLYIYLFYFTFPTIKPKYSTFTYNKIQYAHTIIRLNFFYLFYFYSMLL